MSNARHGDHIDFGSGEFRGPVIGKQVNEYHVRIEAPPPGEAGAPTERLRARGRTADFDDPVLLGVGPALNGTSPPYVPRDADIALRSAIRAGGLVILQGAQGSGKTRTAYEAVRQAVPDRDLLFPSGPDALHELAATADRLRSAVVWLDELDRYVAGSTTVEDDVRRLARAREVVLVATYTPPVTGPLTAREAVSGASPQVVHLRMPLSPTEAEYAGHFRDDDRIDRAMDLAGRYRTGFTVCLAAEQEAVSTWEDALSRGQAGAIISSAVDLRRLGVPDPLTSARLRSAHRHYLPATGDDLDEGFRSSWGEATRTLIGGFSCLMRVDGGYEPLECLVSEADRHGTLGDIPEGVWREAASSVPPSRVLGFAADAYENGHWDIAREMWRENIDRSEFRDACFIGLGLLAFAEGRFDSAEGYFAGPARGGSAEAAYYAGLSCEGRGEIHRAVRWHREAVDGGNSEAGYRLIGMFESGAGGISRAEIEGYRRATRCPEGE
ncbi:hypothetical protein ACFXKD_03525 [Nocardiopsis aegyptia]|uniref:hypothetical protein n=1 Tax=Nocardiopsis aegyptia TaxID=220378 RepID=UPI0036710E3F